MPRIEILYWSFKFNGFRRVNLKAKYIGSDSNANIFLKIDLRV